MLRDYQQKAVDATMEWMRKSVDPCLLELATGAGKSHIIAEVARLLNERTRKRILCLAPSAELVIQNRNKYLATGNPASIFSAAAGDKCLRHPVVFGTPGTVKNKISRFGPEFCAVIVDECHGMTPTIRHIIDSLREKNPLIRIVGLSATPYRLGAGYIYAVDESRKPMAEAREPYFTAKVHTTGGRELVDRGYLTPPVVGKINAENYDTLTMRLNSRGHFDADDVDRAYHGHGRKTAHIIADIVSQSQDRRGALIYAATVRHAEECLASLPPSLSALITADTHKTDRVAAFKKFRLQKLKYLVNVSVLTVGVDFPHVDVIAIMRATESVGLLQQIIGRGMRIDDGKIDFLVLDYANNIERHCPDGDLFAPQVKTFKSAGDAVPIMARCPLCNVVNEFTARHNDGGLDIDECGYYVDLDKNRIKTDYGDMPAHYGRRCMGVQRTGANGEHERCGYRWTFKECPQCGHDNDIAARYCKSCKGEIVDPNEKLVADFKALKKDPTQIQTDNVLDWFRRTVVTRSGKECIRIDYITEYRTFSVWLHHMATSGRMLAEWKQYQAATNDGITRPLTVTYRKDSATSFYKVHDYNRPADEIPKRS